MFIVWLAQTSVDWLHLIPGLTGTALGAAAILLLPAESRGATPSAAHCRCRDGVRRWLSRSLRSSSSAGRRWPSVCAAKRGPDRRQTRAGRSAPLEESLSLNPESVQGYYLRAAALARLGNYPASQGRARRSDSRSPTTTSVGRCSATLPPGAATSPAAMHAYQRGSSLNPRDRELRLLGSRRGLVVRLHRDPESVFSLSETGG